MYGKYSMRFELGGEGEVNSSKRISQATHRGADLLNLVVGDGNTIIIIKEWESDWFDRSGLNRGVIYGILGEVELHRAKGPFDQVYYEKDGQGNKVEKYFDEPLECDLIVTVTKLSQKQKQQIIRGIASLEMGEVPSIPQDVTFYSIDNGIGYRMYDDRGCDMWSDDIKNLQYIYEVRQNWVLNCNRAAIDKMFQG